MDLAGRVARRFIQAAGNVRIVIDRDATNKARESAHKDAIVGEFDSSFPLYRIFDGEEMVRILRSGQISGGTYAVKLERAHGASWGANVTEVIEIGNRLRGGRYGDDLFLAKLDPIGMKFFHLDPKVPFDPGGPEKQPAVMAASVCNFGLGCSIAASLNDVDLYVVHADNRMEPITVQEAKDYVAKRPTKEVDLRAVAGESFQGSILGVDVRVYRDRGMWIVMLNDDRKIVSDAPTKEDAIELAKLSIKMRPSRPLPIPFEVLQQRRRHEKHFEQDSDPNKVRGDFALKPRDGIEVIKGSRGLNINTRDKGVVADVWQPRGDRSVMVKLLFQGRPVTLYATHANRLNEDEIALMNSKGDRILVRKR